MKKISLFLICSLIANSSAFAKPKHMGLKLKKPEKNNQINQQVDKVRKNKKIQ